MRMMSPEEHYINARKLGQKEYARNVSSGQVGYLPSLEGLLKNIDIVSEINIGTIEIPLKKISGTYSHLRSLSFAQNFMPLIRDQSEFQDKWINLCRYHLDEGIKYPIKVYEYLNWFYVIEGNKRVSVLKYFDAYSIYANVSRLIPKRDPNDINICLYYEFLKFNKITNLFTIYFSKIGSFDIMLAFLENYNPSNLNFDNKYKHFEVYFYNPFREIYHKLYGNKLPITTGDAFLEYIKIYGIHDEINEKRLALQLKELITELDIMFKSHEIDVQTDPLEKISPSLLTTLTTLVKPKKTLKVAFVYARTIENSGWTYSHEIGRKYVEQVFGNQIETKYIENTPEDENAYTSIKALVNEGYDVIFTTSPIFMKATLKCSLNFPQVKFFNCSQYQPYAHVGNYYGRTYEPRFLTGIIAGSMTQSDIIGYVATNPSSEVISSINAFSLGAKLVNPHTKVKVVWTRSWNSREKAHNAAEKLLVAGADLISNQNLLKYHPVSRDYGVFSMLCSIDRDTLKPDKYLATPVWHWGIFYEKILGSILNGTLNSISDMINPSSKTINFWWGIASGVLDIFYSKELVPTETQKLVDLMKKMIVDNIYHPFSGPIHDQKGKLMIDKDETASHEQILTMKWFVDNVDVDPYFKIKKINKP